MSFVHLHVHTQYSILDGASRIKSLYSKKDKKMSGIGQTSNDEHVVAIREITR